MRQYECPECGGEIVESSRGYYTEYFCLECEWLGDVPAKKE